MSARRRLAAVALALAALALPAGCGGGDAATAPRATRTAAPWFVGCPSPTGPATGHGLPALDLPCFTGGGRMPLDRAYGRPMVINLWASWCPPCRAELPEIDRYAAAHPDVLVVTVDTGDRRDAGESFARDAKVRLPTLFDERKQLLTAVHRASLPTTLLVTADGRLADTYNSTPLTADALDGLVGRYLG